MTVTTPKPSHLATLIWQIWATVCLTAFLVHEFYWILTGHPENTLSANVWRALKVRSKAPIREHTPLWVLSLGLWLTVTSWLTFHFWFKWW
jgi:hypothetical protein